MAISGHRLRPCRFTGTMDHKVDVVEVTYCNSRSVAEHVVMMILSLVRDYHNQHRIVNEGGWNIADAVQRSYDVEGMHIGTVAAGRIGLDVLRKMKPFDVHLHYFDRHRLPEDVEKELNLTHHESVESLVSVCHVVTINCPLHPETEHLFDDEMIGKMRKGAYIVNTARGKICDREALPCPRPDNLAVMPVMSGSLNPLLMIIYGGPCLTTV